MRRLVPTLLSLCAAAPALAGVTIDLEGRNKKSTLYLQGNKLRMEDHLEGGKEQVMLFDGDKKTLLVLKPETRSYTEMTESSLKEMRSDAQVKMAAARARMTPEQRQQMEDALAKMPPEQRQQMQQLMEAGGTGSQPAETEAAPEVKFVPTGERSKIAGYACESYRTERAGLPATEGCYVAWSTGGITRDDLKPLLSLSAMMSTLLRGGRGDPFIQGLAKAPGFPAVSYTVSASGEKQETNRLTGIKRGSLSADKFTVPDGYSKSQMPAWGGGRPGQADDRARPGSQQ